MKNLKKEWEESPEGKQYIQKKQWRRSPEGLADAAQREFQHQQWEQSQKYQKDNTYEEENKELYGVIVKLKEEIVKLKYEEKKLSKWAGNLAMSFSKTTNDAETNMIKLVQENEALCKCIEELIK